MKLEHNKSSYLGFSGREKMVVQNELGLAGLCIPEEKSRRTIQEMSKKERTRHKAVRKHHRLQDTGSLLPILRLGLACLPESLCHKQNEDSIFIGEMSRGKKWPSSHATVWSGL